MVRQASDKEVAWSKNNNGRFNTKDIVVNSMEMQFSRQDIAVVDHPYCALSLFTRQLNAFFETT